MCSLEMVEVMSVVRLSTFHENNDRAAGGWRLFGFVERNGRVENNSLLCCEITGFLLKDNGVISRCIFNSFKFTAVVHVIWLPDKARKASLLSYLTHR